MRSDVKETVLRSREIEAYALTIPRKQRKETVKTWLKEKEWQDNPFDQESFEDMLLFEKVMMSRLLLKQIIKYGYSWLPTTLQKSGKRIATTAPLLITFNMMVRLSLIPALYASNLPKSPTASFALYTLVTAVIHENEVRILKRAPVVVNQYVSTLSFFFPPRLASLLCRIPTYVFHAALLLRPAEIDTTLAAYFYYASLWFAVVEGLGASAVYMIKDRNESDSELRWGNG